MNTGTTIRKILFVAVWIAIGGLMFTLLLAAMSKKNRGNCRDYVISLNGDENNMFMNREDVTVLLEELMNGPVKGQPITSFKLRELEQKLEQNSWINNAELYFDNRDVLHVSVSEKIPVARVFTVSGQSFYVDNLSNRFPLSEKRSARVPVFTGFPQKKQLNTKDSLLLKEIAATANHIINDPFWNAQVSQIDILPDRTFEMIPVVGDHRVKLGTGENIASKFRRLYVFYQQVLKNTGLNAYKTIDVQYRGQVIASQLSSQGKVDSIQLRKNVEKLLRQAREANQDTVSRIKPAPTKPILPDEEPISKPELPLEIENKNPNPVKAKSVSPVAEDGKEVEKKTVDKEDVEKAGDKKKEEEKRVPKAVMPPKKEPATENENQ